MTHFKCPLIEILLASYNGEKFIEEQIDSILNQTYPQINLLIKDDCSKDSTIQKIQKKIEQYPGKITLIKSPANAGVIRTFSSLMEHSKAEYIMFADHDDVWLPEKVSITFKKMQELEREFDPNIPLLVHTDLAVVDAALNTIHRSYWNYTDITPKSTFTLNRLLLQNVITGCTIMINKPLKKKTVNISDEAIMHDWWLGLVASVFGKIGIVDTQTMLYRQHQQNQIGAKKSNSLRGFLRLCRNPKKFLKPINAFIIQRSKQSQAFLDQYQDELNLQQKKTVQAMVQFNKKSIFNKIYLMVTFKLHKNSFLRNLKEILLTELLRIMSFSN